MGDMMGCMCLMEGVLGYLDRDRIYVIGCKGGSGMH